MSLNWGKATKLFGRTALLVLKSWWPKTKILALGRKNFWAKLDELANKVLEKAVRKTGQW